MPLVLDVPLVPALALKGGDISTGVGAGCAIGTGVGAGCVVVPAYHLWYTDRRWRWIPGGSPVVLSVTTDGSGDDGSGDDGDTHNMYFTHYERYS